MHTNLIRKMVPLAAGAALVAFSACSYNANKPDVLVHVTGVPANAVRGIVTITDTNGDSAQQYFPRFDASNGAALDLSFAAPSAGSYTITVQMQAFDVDDNIVGDRTVSSSGPATFPAAATPVQLTVNLSAVNSDGTYGARCSAAPDG